MTGERHLGTARVLPDSGGRDEPEAVFILEVA